MKLLSDAAVIATFLGALTFVVLYLGRSWRRTAVGVNVLVLMSVITVVSALAVATIFFGRDWPFRDLIRALAWGAVAATIWWRVVLLLRTPKHHRVEPEDVDAGH